MDIEDKNVLIRSTEWSNKDLKLNELNMRGRGGGGGPLVHLLGSRNSLGLLPMIAPEPLCPPNPVNLCKDPFNTAPPPPKFSGNSFSRPHHPFFLSTTHPLLSPFGIPSKLLPSQQTFPLLPFFLALPPPDCCKCPQDCGSFSSPLLQTHTSFSDSGLANSLSLSFSLSPPLSLWLSLPLSPGSKIFTAAAAVRSHGHKTL